MNNEKYNQIIDEAYENYQWKQPKSFPAAPNSNLSKEEFINKIKTDDEFSEKWGLKIKERELSLEERCDEYIKRHSKETNDGVLNYKWIGDNLCTHEDYNEWNIPTKVITITYNNETIESYE